LRKTRKKSGRKTLYLVAASILTLAIVIGVVAFLVMNGSSQKWKATDYFSVVPVAATGWNYTRNDQSLIGVIVSSLSFNVTAKIGDAHEIFVSYRGAQETIENMPYTSTLTKGQSWPAEIQLYNYVAPVNSTGYVIFSGIITIGSQEATPETITLALPYSSVIIFSGEPPT